MIPTFAIITVNSVKLGTNTVCDRLFDRERQLKSTKTAKKWNEAEASACRRGIEWSSGEGQRRSLVAQFFECFLTKKRLDLEFICITEQSRQSSSSSNSTLYRRPKNGG